MLRRDALSALGTTALYSLSLGLVRNAKAEGSQSMRDRFTPATESDMTIERFEITPALPGIPRISYVTCHAGIVYVAGITADPRHRGGIKEQTRDVLARIDSLLNEAGTDK